jgi:lipopolysaccharide export system protein LptC
VTTLRGVGRAWDRISIYLPIILMGLLALGTYWLARNTPLISPAPPARAPTHEPDYFLKHFSVKSFDPSGRMKSELVGIEARHFADTDTMEVDEPRIRSFGEDGSLLTATAHHGISNSDGSQVQLLGNAVVIRHAAPEHGAGQPDFEVRSEFLHAFVDTEQLKSNKPVTLIRGGDRFQGDGLDYDNQKRLLVLTGNVHGVIQARGAPAGAATAPATAPAAPAAAAVGAAAGKP